MRLLRALACALTLALAACGADPAPSSAPAHTNGPEPTTVRVLVAASLVPALDDALKVHRAAYPDISVEVDAGGSVVLARRVAELGAACDLLLVADAEVMDAIVVPKGAAKGWVAFAGGSVAIACVPGTALARDLEGLPPARRLERLARPGVRIARTSPGGAPIGARALLVFSLAEKHQGPPGVAAALLANAPDSLARPQLPLCEALVQAGEADACLDYPSSAAARGLAVFALPPEVDLSDPARASTYAQVSVDVPSERPGEKTRVAGAPVRYAAAIPVAAKAPIAARALLAIICSAEGRAVLERHGHRPIAPLEKHGAAPDVGE